jgi:acyl-CoA dehydrogenase
MLRVMLRCPPFLFAICWCLLDAMDIMGGAGIMRGPANIIGNGYMNIPIANTVEGANILTRSLISFGQGLTRGSTFTLVFSDV